MCFGIIRLDLQCLLIQSAGFGNPSLSRYDEAEVVVCHPAIRISHDCRPVQGLGIAIHRGLKPGERAQYADRYDRDRRLPSTMSDGSDPPEECQAGEVLKVTGYKGINERVNVEESQRRKKGTGEKQQHRQGAARPPADEPRRNHERNHGGGIEILPPHSSAHGPSRINEYQVERP